MAFRMYMDIEGYARAEFDPPYQLLSWYLELDVQRVPQHARELLELVDEFISGRTDLYEGTGNAHEIMISPDVVRIENDYTSERPPVELSLKDFRSLLECWLRLLETEETQGSQWLDRGESLLASIELGTGTVVFDDLSVLDPAVPLAEQVSRPEGGSPPGRLSESVPH